VERISFEKIGLGDAQQIALNDYAGANLAGRRAPKKSPAATVLGHPRDQALGKAMDRRCVLVVGAHQRGTRRLSVLGLEAQHRLDPFLHLEGELIEVASAQKMQ